MLLFPLKNKKCPTFPASKDFTVIGEIYTISHNEELTRIYFVSEGTKGKILKIVAFSWWEDNTWNLGFGDYRNQRIDDRVVSNNGDIGKVIRTVAASAIAFLAKYSDRKVLIQPVDERRKRLYNIVFQRHCAEIAAEFKIMGLQGTEMKQYSPDEIYDAFELSRKEPTFTKK